MSANAATRKLVAEDRETARKIGVESRLSLIGGSADRNGPSGARLTARQLEVLALLCEGLPNKLICRRLNVAAGTVKAHISSILRELGVKSRLQAVVAARRMGLLNGGPSDEEVTEDGDEGADEDVQDTLRTMGLSGRGRIN